MTPDAVPKATPAPKVAPPNPTSRVIPTPAPIAADSASSPQLQGRRFRMKVQSVRESPLIQPSLPAPKIQAAFRRVDRSLKPERTLFYLLTQQILMYLTRQLPNLGSA